MPIETPTWRALCRAQNWRSAQRYAAKIELENELEFSIAAKYWLQRCPQKNFRRGALNRFVAKTEISRHFNSLPEYE